MIVGSTEQFPIGFRGEKLIDYLQHTVIKQPYVVIREATHEEFLESCAEVRRRKLTAAEESTLRRNRFFYQISTD